MTVELDRIDTEIATHRRLYLEADTACHTGEQEFHETEIDKLLGEQRDLQREAAPA